MNVVLDIQEAIDYIEENIFDELDNVEIAKQACMSVYYFQRTFSFVCNITLGEYIRNRRLSLSKDDLMRTNMSIIDIALGHGYSTPEGFTRAFYRYYGITPSAARKRKFKLDSFDRISVSKILKGEINQMNDLAKRGYTVENMGAIYYTKDMDKTKKWFEDILGLYAGIDARNEEGNGIYGCVLPFPGELVHMKITEFNGFHMFYGVPEKRTMLFVNITEIEKLYSLVRNNGWDEITEITMQPWGGLTCDVTTIDGCIIKFCEVK